jgi:hypothetical protein
LVSAVLAGETLASAKPARASPERRSHQRLAAERTVHVAANGFSWSCQLIDVTPAGARVALGDNAAWPDEIILRDPELALTFRCRVAWRSATELGLHFVEIGTFDQLFRHGAPT